MQILRWNSRTFEMKCFYFSIWASWVSTTVKFFGKTPIPAKLVFLSPNPPPPDPRHLVLASLASPLIVRYKHDFIKKDLRVPVYSVTASYIMLTLMLTYDLSHILLTVFEGILGKWHVWWKHLRIYTVWSSCIPIFPSRYAYMLNSTLCLEQCNSESCTRILKFCKQNGGKLIITIALTTILLYRWNWTFLYVAYNIGYPCTR